MTRYELHQKGCPKDILARANPGDIVELPRYTNGNVWLLWRKGDNLAEGKVGKSSYFQRVE